MSSLAARLRMRAKRSGSVPLQPWVRQGALLHIQFHKNRAWYAGTYPSIASLISTTRTTPGLVNNLAGLYSSVAANQMRISDRGLLIEWLRTNLVLHSRALNITHQLIVSGGSGIFLTGEPVTATGGGAGNYSLVQSTATEFAILDGAGTFTGTLTGTTSGATVTIDASALVWVKTNLTALKIQTGIDGLANTATRITATASNASVFQATVSASMARWASVFVKRIIGTGAVQMTMDNGGTWTTIPVTGAWVQVNIPNQSIANPTFGLRIVTAGDAIAVDGCQIEQSSVDGTSPIFTTTTAVTRNADNTSFLLSLFPGLASATFIVEAEWPQIIGGVIFLEGESITGLTLGSSINGLNPRTIVRHGVTSRMDESHAVAPAAGSVFRIGATWDATAAGRGAGNGVHTAGVAATQVDFSGTKIFLGSRNGGSQVGNTFYRELIVMSHRVPDAQFDAITLPTFEFDNSEASILVASFSSEPDEMRKRYIDTLISALKADDIWDKIDAFYVFASHDQSASLRNWKSPGVYDAVAVNSPVFMVDRGYIGNGTNSRLTSYIPSTQGVQFTLNSASMGLWSNSSGQITNASMGSMAAGTVNQLLMRNASDNLQYRMNDGTTSTIANADGSGLYVAVRPNSTTKRMYRNGAQIGSDAAVVSTAVATQPMWIGGSNSSNFSTAEIAAALFAGALSASENASLNAALGSYMTAVGP